LKLKLTVDGKVYEVEVEVAEPEKPHPAYIPPVGQARRDEGSFSAASEAKSASDSVADESKVCRSPIAGVVVRVPVQVGQEIQVNDVLMVLEAMKMETQITAPIPGKVARINAAVGDSVRSKQVLVEIE
jgi:methylmalonyl-CoA carboxyltransferase small subunit